MPTTRSEGHRIANSWITASALNAGSYLITAFTVNSDQKQDNNEVVPWIPPINTSWIVKRKVYDQMITGRQRGQGLIEASWTFSMFTHGMAGVFEAYYDDPDESQKFTIKTYDMLDVARYLQCYGAPFSTWFDGATPVLGGWQNVTIPFVGGTEIS